MKKRLMLCAAVFVCCCAAAMEWPLPEAAMVRNFGFNDRGRPVLGIVFEGEGEVLAADSGERIFSRSRRDPASRLPSALGAWSAIDHGDGLVSIYGRYRDEGAGSLPPTLSLGTPLAPAGNSGWSRKDGVYFMLYDRRERRWLNASMVINPYPDTAPPQILSVQLRSENARGRLIESSQFRNLSQGRYTIIVTAIDTQLDPKGLPLAPHRIICSVNGEEAGSLALETMSARDGALLVNRNGLIPARQVFSPYPAFEAGEVQLSRGQAQLEVVVHDVAGNAQSALFRMVVE